MKPEYMPQSDVLDILFENRNKAYGAYYLRRHYNGYLLKALTAMLFIAGTVIFLSTRYRKERTNRAFVVPGILPLHPVEPVKFDPPPPRVQPLPIRIQFVVAEDGSVGDFKVIQSGGEKIDLAVIKVLQKMPRWKPARKNGRDVAMYFVQPVSFETLEE